MAKPKFNIDQINVGDEVEYIDFFLSPKRFRWWKVVSKLHATILIQLNSEGRVETRAVEAGEILSTIKLSRYN